MNKISLYKTGKFYNAYGDNGIILHYLLKYKYTEYKNSVGFPDSALNKVKTSLENNNISYAIYNKDILIEDYKGIDKNYKNTLKEALKSYDMESRITRLKNKINNLELDDLEKIIEGLEDVSI